jgi:hypothetical protein
MSGFLFIIIKSTLCLSVLYGLYVLLLKRGASFRLNRLTLLLIILVSLAIPLIQQPFALGNNFFANFHRVAETTVLEAEKTESIVMFSKNTENKEIVTNQDTLPMKHEIRLLPAVYFAGMIICLTGMLVSLICVLWIVIKARRSMFGPHKILVSHYRINSFSFAGWIVLSETDFQQHADEIVTHETIHRREAHCVDVCLIDILVILHWFNPFVWALRREIRSVHEYEADYHTLNQGIDAAKYQLLLIEKAAGASRFAIASSFAQSKIKKRLIMMNKKFNPKMRWRTLLFIPMTALLTQAFARPENSAEQYSDIWNMSEPTLQATGDDTVKLKKDSASTVVYMTSKKEEKNAIRDKFAKLESAALIYNGRETTLKDAVDELSAFIKDRELEVDIIQWMSAGHDSKRDKYGMRLHLPEIDRKQPQIYYFIDGKWWWSWENDATLIQSIETMEPDAAVKRFGKKAKNGAIVMKTSVTPPPPPVKKSENNPKDN